MRERRCTPASVRLRFERGNPPGGGALERFARAAQAVVQSVPASLPSLSFGSAAGVYSCQLDALLPARTNSAPFRIRAIEVAGKPVLENRFDSAGHRVMSAFPDGVVVTQSHTASGLLSAVRINDICRAAFEYDARGRCTRARYPGDPEVVVGYRWTDSGQLSGVDLPGTRLSLRRTRSGGLSSVEGDLGQISLRFAGNQGPAEVAFQGLSDRWSFASSQSRADVMSLPCLGSDRLHQVSPLGIHTYDGSGRILGWLHWCGECMHFLYKPSGQLAAICSQRGLTRFSWADGGRTLAVLRPDGHRAVWHGDRQEGSVLLLSPKGATAQMYNRRGQLLHSVDCWGSCASFGYGALERAALPRTVRSPQWGCATLAYGVNSSLAKLTEDGNGAVRLRLDTTGRLQRVSWRSRGGELPWGALTKAGWLHALTHAGVDSYREAFGWPRIL